jgi:hypothetical protein
MINEQLFLAKLEKQTDAIQEQSVHIAKLAENIGHFDKRMEKQETSTARLSSRIESVELKQTAIDIRQRLIIAVATVVFGASVAMFFGLIKPDQEMHKTQQEILQELRK